MRARASDFFHDGVLARTGRLVLREPREGDLPAYLETLPRGLRELYSGDDAHGERLRSEYWDDIADERALYCTVVERGRGGVCGYCCVEDLACDPTELGIELVPRARGRGIGTESVRALMAGIRRVAGPVEFVAKIDPRNAASQHLFRKLGFAPAGIAASMLGHEDTLRAHEEAHLGELDGRLLALAAEFGVEPRRLLTHDLVFAKGM